MDRKRLHAPVDKPTPPVPAALMDYLEATHGNQIRSFGPSPGESAGAYAVRVARLAGQDDVLRTLRRLHDNPRT